MSSPIQIYLNLWGEGGWRTVPNEGKDLENSLE